MLYTFPLKEDHASSAVLCFLSSDGVTRWSDVKPLRSEAPDDLRRAQSNGLCPGVSATLSRALALRFTLGMGFVVVGGGASADEEVGDEDGDKRMNVGGGIRAESDKDVAAAGWLGRSDRCMLWSDGNAGGASSSSFPPFPPSVSSESDAGGDGSERDTDTSASTGVTTGGAGDGARNNDRR